MFEPISLFSIDVHKVYVEEWSEHKDRMLSYMTDGYGDKTISFTDYFTYISQGQYPPYRNEFLELMGKYVEQYLQYMKELGHSVNTKDPNGTYNFSKIEGPWILSKHASIMFEKSALSLTRQSRVRAPCQLAAVRPIAMLATHGDGGETADLG